MPIPKSSRRAFTLIELLVVIAIIALLAAILFPVFARARENARRTSCLSNLKQVGIGIAQYTQDYDEYFPITDTPGTYWPDAQWTLGIDPYVKSSQLVICPSDPWKLQSFTPYTTGAAAGKPRTRVSYVINERIARKTTSPLRAAKLSEVTYSTFVILLAETNREDSGEWTWPRAIVDFSQSHTPHNERHFNGSNLLFVDGHAKWFNMTGRATTYFNLFATPACKDVKASLFIEYDPADTSTDGDCRGF